MSLVIELPKETEEILEQEASKHGLHAPEYAQQLIERQLPKRKVIKEPTGKLKGRGAYAHLLGSVDGLLREKHEELDREERAWEERHRGLRS